MSIWFKAFTPAQVQEMHVNTLAGHLGIELTEVGADCLLGRMPIDQRTVQPYRTVHGGALVTLAETLGSIGAAMTVDLSRHKVVGQEINANHLRSVSSGHVLGRARPIHLGARSQVWGIEITDDQQRLCCISRLTIAVIGRRD